jgi:hypothetical protein
VLFGYCFILKKNKLTEQATKSGTHTTLPSSITKEAMYNNATKNSK